VRLMFDDYVLDASRRELWRGTELIAIEPQVFDLLAYLVQNPDRVISRDELLNAVWDGRIVSDSAIGNRINAVRRAIADSGDAQRLIRTVPRKGFRFIGVVEEHVAPVQEGRLQKPYKRSLFSAMAGAASVALSAAIAVFLLWPGIGSPWAVAVRMLSGPSQSLDAYPKFSGMPRLGIAVLPLTAVGGNSEQMNLAVGITENLTAELSRATDLRVTSSQTASTYLQKPVAAKQIGRELGVRYIIDGSIEQVNGQIRVTARLADAETGTYLWADRYDRPAGDPMEVEDEIVGRTINGVRRALTFSEASRSQDERDAAQLVWRGSAVMIAASSRKMQTPAAQLFERAVDLSPSMVPAQFRLAGALAVISHGLFNINDDEKLRRASDLADVALAAWPNNSATHYVKGQVLRMQGHCDQAIPEFEMAIAINRYSTAAYSRLAYCRFMTGAVSDVAALEDQAMRFASRDANFGAFYSRIGMAELLESHTDEAIFWLEKSRTAEATRQSEGVYEISSYLAAAYALKGDNARAADALAEARKSDEYPTSVAQYCRQSPLCMNQKTRALAEATYFKGLRLAGLPEE
jgi:TolB-like protein/DNA-binding winged helix-turn-helix (wHTH) protein